jgi:hypothetical protein
MKGNLQTRVARLERALPPEKDDLYLGTVDEQGTIKAPPTEPSDWHERIMKAAEQLAGTMAPEHYEHVLRESCGQEASLQNVSNLTLQFWRMAAFMVDCEDDRGSVFHRKREFALPATVAQIYLDYPEATPIDECGGCGYFVPVLLNQSIQHSTFHLHAKRFFIYCPLCNQPTGYCSHPYGFWDEIERVKALRSTSVEAKA